MDAATITKIQHVLDQGRTQKEAAEEASVSVRTVSRLIQNGDVKPLRRRRSASPQAKNALGANYRRMWSPADLQGIFSLDKVPSILLLLETEARRGNWRVHEWIGRMRELRRVPVEWRDAIGFLPILAKDIRAPALAKLADLMRNEIPWTTKEMRSRYRRKATPVMDKALIEIGSWSAAFGLVPYYKQRESGKPPEFVGMADVTEIPYEHDQKGLAKKFHGTLFGLLIELVGRLPDVDRPSGRSLVPPGGSRLRSLGRKRATMTALAVGWCMTVDDQWVQGARNVAGSLWTEESEKEDGEK